MTEVFFSQVRLRPEGFQALAAGKFQKILHEFLVAHRRIAKQHTFQPTAVSTCPGPQVGAMNFTGPRHLVILTPDQVFLFPYTAKGWAKINLEDVEVGQYVLRGSGASNGWNFVKEKVPSRFFHHLGPKNCFRITHPPPTLEVKTLMITCALFGRFNPWCHLPSGKCCTTPTF